MTRSLAPVALAALLAACGSGSSPDRDVPVALDFGLPDLGADPGPRDDGPPPDDGPPDAGPPDAGPCPPPVLDPECLPCDGTTRSWCPNEDLLCFCGTFDCAGGGSYAFTRLAECGVHRRCEGAKCVPYCDDPTFGDAGRVTAIRIGKPEECLDWDEDGVKESGLEPSRPTLDLALETDLDQRRYGLAVEAVPTDGGFALRLLAGTWLPEANVFQVARAGLDTKTCETPTWVAPKQWPTQALETVPRDVPFRWPFLPLDSAPATLEQAVLSGALAPGTPIDAPELRLTGVLGKGDVDLLMQAVADPGCNGARVCTALTNDPPAPDLNLDLDPAMKRDHLSVCLFLKVEPVAMTMEP